jgi:RecA/RadA recombinase
MRSTTKTVVIFIHQLRQNISVCGDPEACI